MAPTRISTIATSEAPSLVVAGPDPETYLNLTDGGNLLIAWKGESTHKLYWALHPFSDSGSLDGSDLGGGPSVSISDPSDVVAVWRDSAGAQIHRAWATNGPDPTMLGTWTGVQTFDKARTDSRPTVCANADGDYVFWRGDNSGTDSGATSELWWLADNGQPQQGTRIDDAAPASAPAVAVGLQGQDSGWATTYVVWANGSDQLEYTVSSDGIAWSGPQVGPTSFTKLPPAAVVFGGQLLVAWVLPDSGQIVYSTIQDTPQAGPDWSIPAAFASAETDAAPALAVWNGALYLAWKERGSSSVSFDRFASPSALPQPGPDHGIPIPLTNVVTTQGLYTAEARLGKHSTPVTLMVDTGSSTLAVASGYQPDDDASTTSLAQYIPYGSGPHPSSFVFGPVLETTVTLVGENHVPSLPHAPFLLAEAADSSKAPYAGADGIVGLAYTPLNEAYDVSGYLKSHGKPTTTYPWPSDVLKPDDGPKLSTLPHVIRQDVDPYYTGLEQDGVVPNSFGLWVHRSHTSQRTSPPAANPANQGLLVLGDGEAEVGLHGGVFQVAPIRDDTFYVVHLKAIQVGNDAPISAPGQTSGSDPEANAVVDSGTAWILLPPPLLGPVIDAISATSGVNEEILTFIPQPSAAVRAKSWPMLTFTLEGADGDVNLLCDPAHYWQFDAPQAGQATFVISQRPDFSTLGLPLLSSYYTVFDRSAIGGGVMRFAQKPLYVS